MNLTLNQFVKENYLLPYNVKRTRTLDYIQNSPHTLHDALSLFVQFFPFDTTQVFRLLDLKIIKELKDTYKTLLSRNMKSLILWQAYLQHLKENEPSSLKQQLQLAIDEVGLHILSESLYLEYAEVMDKPCQQAFKFYIDAFKKPIELKNLWTHFQSWMSRLTLQQLTIIVQVILRQSSNGRSKQELIELLTAQAMKARDFYSHYRSKRISMRADLVQHEDYIGDCQAQSQWLAYLKYQRQCGTPESISYAYQEALIPLCYRVELWKQLFNYQECVICDHLRNLKLLRRVGTFFVNLSSQISFYWCDLQQRERSNVQKQIYNALQNINPSIQTFFRHAQYQVRAKELVNAKACYQRLLLKAAKNEEELCFVVGQYAEFVRRKFNDFQFPKNLLFKYLMIQPFNKYLFYFTLDFLKNYQQRQAFFDDIQNVLQIVIPKAKAFLNERELQDLSESVRNQLRKLLMHIELIRLGERKLKSLLI